MATPGRRELDFAVVEPRLIESLWRDITPGIRAAMEGSDESSLDATREGLVSGRLTLLLMSQAGGKLGAVVRTVQFHNYSVMRVLYAFGRGMDEMQDAMLAAEAWAKSLGCRYLDGLVVSESRARLFAKFGFSKKYINMRKPL